ncbi:MAG: tetratricopeptide repeat protein [Planctomycetes bacterium]|nr:tetratricopeptide repeat protein [Planctomycetota bacterium]
MACPPRVRPQFGAFAFLLTFLIFASGTQSASATLASIPSLAPEAVAQNKPPTMAAAERLVRASKWPKAIAAFESISAAEPENGLAWFYLSYCHHNTGDLRKALEYGLKAAEFPDVRATSFYNMACAHSSLGEIEQATECLANAQSAGYLDFDSIETDPELKNLRDKVDLHLPKKHKFSILRGRNGIEIPYYVLLPTDFDVEKEYSVAISFAQGSGGKRSSDWCIEKLWGGKSTRADWIVVCAAAPKNGWINHPSHHALEDLFKKLRKDYTVASNSFHLVGFGAGARVATTYSGMSKKYVASLTVASWDSFARWDDDDFKRPRKIPIHQIVGVEAKHLLEKVRASKAKFDQFSVTTTVTECKGDGFALKSLHAGKLLDVVADQISLGL